jgi:hypothetical protein
VVPFAVLGAVIAVTHTRGVFGLLLSLMVGGR